MYITEIAVRVKDYIDRYGLIKSGEKVLVCHSSGPDSTALLFILNELKGDLNISFHLTHLNHCLRGEESDGDEKFSRNLANKLGIGFTSKRVGVKRISEERSMSLEETAREVRYQFFNRVAEEENCDKIATGHTADDQVETFLHRLIRGSGLRGLSSIPPIRDGIYVRPLLSIRREEIIEYLTSNEIEYRVDSSNVELDFFRNKIRHILLPLLRDEFNENIDEVILRTVKLIREDNRYLETLAGEEVPGLRDDGFVFNYDELRKKPFALKSRMLRRAVDLLGAEYPPTFERIREVFSAVEEGGKTKTIQLIGDIHARYSSGELRITRGDDEPIIKGEVELEIPGTTRLNGGVSISARVLEEEGVAGDDELLLDMSAVVTPVIARHPRDGDAFQPDGMSGHKKVYDFLADVGVPVWERKKTLIIEDGLGIISILGYRVDDRVRIMKDTDKILALRVIRDE